MYWKVKTNAVKSLYLQMDKITKILLLPETMATCQKNLKATYCLRSIFDYQNPIKEQKRTS